MYLHQEISKVLIPILNSLSSNELSSQGIIKLCNIINQSQPKVKELWLGSNPFNNDCMTSIGEIIQNNGSLQKLSFGAVEDMDNFQISDKGIEMLSDYLVGNTTLQALDFHGVYTITDGSVPYFVQIAKYSCISCLDIALTTVSDEHQEEIERLIGIPVDQREIQIKSNTKSASKIS